MLSKFKVFITFLVFGGLFLTGCVDEPDMEILERPYTQLRVANFVTNADVLNVSIDNTNDGVDNFTAMNSFTSLGGSAVANNLTNGQYTAYFDVNAGNRNIRLQNSSGTVIFEGLIGMGSYEEAILIFTGTYDANEDNNTVMGQYIWLGQTYLDDYHQLPDPNGEEKVYLESNQGVLKCIHAAAGVYTGGQTDLELPYTFITLTNNTLGEIDTLLGDADDALEITSDPHYVGGIITEGNYDLEFYSIQANPDDANILDTLSHVTGTFDLKAGMTTLIVLHGEPSNASFAKYEESLITSTRPR
ncbi:MAG: hypothetical protein SCALA702_07120 [Melioribacteraceae bacterium]|nr:MAG: hypothetical protein SCALA702_07120 [Melioribacteraceae bacterium]